MKHDYDGACARKYLLNERVLKKIATNYSITKCLEYNFLRFLSGNATDDVLNLLFRPPLRGRNYILNWFFLFRQF